MQWLLLLPALFSEQDDSIFSRGTEGYQIGFDRQQRVVRFGVGDCAMCELAGEFMWTESARGFCKALSRALF